MGKGLKEFKKSNKKLADGKSPGSQKWLTEKVMESFQKHYGQAIRNNKGNLDAMKRAEWAILYHSVKSNCPKKQQQYCPEGKSSWYKWQKDEAAKPEVKTYSDEKCLPEVFLQA